jgi:hypothetical protein
VNAVVTVTIEAENPNTGTRRDGVSQYKLLQTGAAIMMFVA